MFSPAYTQEDFTQLLDSATIPPILLNDGDRRKAGSAQPKVTFGWNNTLNYKNWSLTAFFQGIAGNKIFNATRAFYNNVWTL